MSAVQDGPLIEGVLYLLDNNPIINPTFNSPAISIAHLAGSLGFNPSLIHPRQICQAIAPLAETLFPTPRIPVFRTHANEGWIVFEETSMTNVKPLRLAKRTTLTSYSNEGKVNVNIPPGRDGVPSAPFQTAGKLGVKVPNGDTPISAGIGMGQGRKSFLRPFLLGGRKKKGEMPAAAMHKSRKEEEFNVPKSQDGFQGVGDDHLQVDLESPESPYEDTASPSKDEVGGVGEASPVGAPLVKGKKGVTKRVAAMRIDEVAPSSPGIVTPKTPNITLAPITPATPVSPLNVPSPVPTPTTAFIQLSPIEAQVPISPIPITPITPSQAIKTPPSPIGSIPNTPIPTTHVIPAGTISSHRESERKLESGRDRHHRNREETNDERRTRKEREREREHSKRERGSGERKPRSSRSDVEKEDTWLEVVFEDLPFGPDKNMSRAMESIKRDYKIFIAEIIALGGLAYVIQRSGW